MKNIGKHVQHYAPLIGILVAGVIGFILFPNDIGIQMAAIIATAAGYVSWGIIHHHLSRDLEASIVVEYVMVAVLGVTVVFSLLLRS
jgi:hypothetical protein